MAPRAQRRGRRTRKLLDLAWEKFHACETCMPSEAFEYLEDLLIQVKMTKAERGRLATNVCCPHCEARLAQEDRVVPYSHEELRDIRRWSLWVKRYAAQFQKFHEFLIDHPSLGGLHNTGQLLAKAVLKSPVKIVNRNTWYRGCRYIEGKQFCAADFFPSDRQRAHRYNHAGQFALYLANTPEGSATELLQRKGEVRIWIAKLNVRKRLRALNATIPILGMSEYLPLLLSGLVFTGALTMPVQDSRCGAPQYVVPRYIADLVRRRGLEGILYTSSKEFPFKPDVFGTNLVIINSNFRKFISIKEYGLYRWHETIFCEPFNLPTMKLEKIS